MSRTHWLKQRQRKRTSRELSKQELYGFTWRYCAQKLNLWGELQRMAYFVFQSSARRAFSMSMDALMVTDLILLYLIVTARQLC